VYFREPETVPNQTTGINFHYKIGKNDYYYINMAAIYTDYFVGQKFLALISRKTFED